MENLIKMFNLNYHFTILAFIIIIFHYLLLSVTQTQQNNDNNKKNDTKNQQIKANRTLI